MSTPIPSLGNKTPEQLKVAELREELKKRGINVKGLKKDLVERLDEVLRQEAAEADDLSKKSSPEDEASDDEEEQLAAAPAVVEVDLEPTEVDAVATIEVKQGAVELDVGESLPLAEELEPVAVVLQLGQSLPLAEESNPGVVALELRGSTPLVGDLRPGTVGPELTLSIPEEDGLSVEGKEGETDRLQVIVKGPGFASEDTIVAIRPSGDVTAESVPEADFQASTKLDDDSEKERENSPAIENSDEGKLSEGEAKGGKLFEGKLFEGEANEGKLSEGESNEGKLDEGESYEGKLSEGEAKLETREMGEETLDSGEFFKNADKMSLDNAVEAKSDAKPSEAEVQFEGEQLKPFRYSGPASSTDAVIIEASEADDIPRENAFTPKGLRTAADGDRDMEEGEGSVVEETGAEPMEIKRDEGTMTVDEGTRTVETVSIITETTVVTTETVVVTEGEADLSTAEAEHEEGSFTRRSSDAGTLSIDGKEKDAVEEHHRDKDEDGLDEIDEEQDKVKDSKPMEIDSDSLTGFKRKDGDESRHQEPAKRQRRWNSEKSAGAISDVKGLPNVITTDTFKEIIAPEVRDSQAPAARSPSTTASSTPKASASTSFDKPAPSRPALSRTDIAVNGEVDKKRLVPPPSRTPTTSLKIDRFVRPFTIKAVRELLEQTGTVKEMWMDQIKTHCYVTYSLVEEAIATRNALYHLQWPVAGGKLLVAEFVEPEEVKLRVEGLTDKPAPTPVTTPRGAANNSAQAAGSAGLISPAASVPASVLPPPPPLPQPPRERPALPPKKEPEPPIPTLDDLFKKTRTKPQIYFLPLTEEQAAAKLRNKQPVSKAPVKA